MRRRIDIVIGARGSARPDDNVDAAAHALA